MDKGTKKTEIVLVIHLDYRVFLSFVFVSIENTHKSQMMYFNILYLIGIC
jgi:hypothetical protein